jgi:Thiol-disulfide isomerase and thioredoxins
MRKRAEIGVVSISLVDNILIYAGFKRSMLTLLLSLLVLSCKLESRQEIVLIVKNAPDQKYFIGDDGSRKSNIFFSDISYIDDSGTVQQHRFKSPIDTIRIRVNRTNVEVGMQFKGIEEAYFLLKRGDSIDVTYRNGYPYLASRSIGNLTLSYNLATNISNRTVHGGFDVGSLMEKNMILYSRLQSNPDYIKQFPSIYKDYINPFYLARQQRLFIGKLKDTMTLLQGRLAADYYNYYMYQARKRENDWKLYQLQATKSSDIHIDSIIDDRYSYYISYRRILHNFFTSSSISKKEWERKSLQSRSYDFSKIFDHILSLGISQKSRDILLEFCIENIVDEGSITEIKYLTDQFVKITGNAHFVDRLLAEAEIAFYDGDKLYLEDAYGMPTNFEEVLQRVKGKVAYVDFWASWCAPCIAAMPHAQTLRVEFEDADVVFIYLALNDRRDPWKDAVTRYNVGYLSESYYIANSRSSKFIENMKVRQIPRYMLFDKNGDLAHANAPGPDGAAIRKQLRQLLAK